MDICLGVEGMNIASFLIALIGPLAVRVVLALGMSVITFSGVDLAVGSLISGAQASWSGIGADVLGLAGVAGVPACLGLLAGALNARGALWVLAAASKWIVK